MLKKILFGLVIAAAMISCGGAAKQARDYNNDIVNKERDLIPDVTKTENSVKTFFAAGEYESIGKEGSKMEALIQKKIDEIKAIPLPKAKGADKLRGSALEYFAFLKSAYSNYRKLGEAATEEERQDIIAEVRDIYSRRTEIVEQFRDAQRKYASDNGFRLEQPKYGE